MIVKRESLTPIDFDGLRIFDFTAGQHLGSSFAFIEVPPGMRHAEAWSRRSDKYYFVASGRIQFALDGHTFDLSAGTFCFVRRGQHFGYRNDGAELATLVLVHTPDFRIDDEVFV